MDTRLPPSRLFLGLTAVSAVVGVCLYERGFPLEAHFNPLMLMMLPRLVRFAVAVLFAAIGFV